MPSLPAAVGVPVVQAVVRGGPPMAKSPCPKPLALALRMRLALALAPARALDQGTICSPIPST